MIQNSAPDEKTTIISVKQMDDSFNLCLEHRYYQDVKIEKSSEMYLRFLVNINIASLGGTYLLETRDETEISVELDNLPADCSLGTMNIVTDPEGDSVGDGTQIAVVAKLESGSMKWTVVNPKLYIKDLYLRQENQGFYPPLVEMSIDITLLKKADYEAWLSDAVANLPKTVPIGYIAASIDDYNVKLSFMEQIVEPDLNAYAASVGSPVRFDIQVVNANGQIPNHLALVQQFHSQGVDLIIGGGWSSMAQNALPFIEANNMLLFSASSTAPSLSIAGDRLFRMCPSDACTGVSLADVLWSYGIKEVVVMNRGDEWGDGLVNLFVPAWTAKGGLIAGNPIRYDITTTDFSGILDVAEQQVASAVAAFGPERVGVVCFVFNEAAQIALQAQYYPNVYSATWFGSDGTSQNWQIRSLAPEQAVHMEFLSLLYKSPDTPEFNTLAARYEAVTGDMMNSYTANAYDIAMVLAKAILMKGTNDAGVLAGDMINVSSNHQGASGLCVLNEFGDRVPPAFQIWTYHVNASGVPTDPAVSVIVGEADPSTRVVIWDTDALGYLILGP